jgi:hypothetical protein
MNRRIDSYKKKQWAVVAIQMDKVTVTIACQAHCCHNFVPLTYKDLITVRVRKYTLFVIKIFDQKSRTNMCVNNVHVPCQSNAIDR